MNVSQCSVYKNVALNVPCDCRVCPAQPAIGMVWYQANWLGLLVRDAKPVGSPLGYAPSRLLAVVNWSVNLFACVQCSTCTFCRTPPSTECHANLILWIVPELGPHNWLPWQRPLRIVRLQPISVPWKFREDRFGRCWDNRSDRNR